MKNKSSSSGEREFSDQIVVIRRHRLVARLAGSLTESIGPNAAVDGQAAPGSDTKRGATEARRGQHRSDAIRLAVGVSGGADSLALLIGCIGIRARSRAGAFRVDPVAIHVHHHLRESADEDAVYVTELCRQFDVHCTVAHVYPSERKGNLAANARALRYEAMAEHAERHSCGFVAVAHHADDQFETMLMNLCRGAGPYGLAGMSALRRLTDAVTLIRPMLDWSREECQELCAAANIKWRDDPTNVDAETLRGRLRADVIPVLEQLWPGASRAAARSSEFMRHLDALLERDVCNAFGPTHRRCWPRSELCALPQMVVASGLRRAAVNAVGHDRQDDFGLEPAWKAAGMIADSVRRPRRLRWPGGLELHIDARKVEMTCSEADDP